MIASSSDPSTPEFDAVSISILSTTDAERSGRASPSENKVGIDLVDDEADAVLHRRTQKPGTNLAERDPLLHIFCAASDAETEWWKEVAKKLRRGTVDVTEYPSRVYGLSECSDNIVSDVEMLYLQFPRPLRVIVYIDTKERCYNEKELKHAMKALSSLRSIVDRLTVIVNTNQDRWEDLHGLVHRCNNVTVLQKVPDMDPGDFFEAVKSVVKNRALSIGYLASYLKYVTCGRKHGFRDMWTFPGSQYHAGLRTFM
jgi:hypothetical protein